MVVDDPAAIVLGADLVAASSPLPMATGEPTTLPAGSPVAAGAARQAGFGLDPTALPGTGAGLASLLLIGLASVAVTLIRRRQAQRLSASRVAARLATLTDHPVGTTAATAPATAGGPPVERAQGPVG